MDVEKQRDYCLTKTGAEQFLPFGPDNIIFKVNSKMFMLLSLDEEPTRFNVKCDPLKAEEFAARICPDIARIPHE